LNKEFSVATCAPAKLHPISELAWQVGQSGDSDVLQIAKRFRVSIVIGPSGEAISDTLCESEGLLYQDIDISQCVEPKQFHDIVGHYNRFDVFELNVTRKRLTSIVFSDDDAEHQHLDPALLPRPGSDRPPTT
jgi:aliphatic nitrilase